MPCLNLSCCSTLPWPCHVWSTPVILRSLFTLILEVVFAVLDLSSCVPYFLLFFLYHRPCPLEKRCLWGQFLETVQGWKFFIVSLLRLTLLFLLCCLLAFIVGLEKSEAFWSVILCTGLFISPRWKLVNSSVCSWPSEIHGQVAWCGSIFLHCAGSRQAFSIRQHVFQFWKIYVN